jgi:hypothetical protein
MSTARNPNDDLKEENGLDDIVSVYEEVGYIILEKINELENKGNPLKIKLAAEALNAYIAETSIQEATNIDVTILSINNIIKYLESIYIQQASDNQQVAEIARLLNLALGNLKDKNPLSLFEAEAQIGTALGRAENVKVYLTEIAEDIKNLRHMYKNNLINSDAIVPNNREKAINLLRVMLPIFAKKYSFSTPKAYHELISFAKSNGITERDIFPEQLFEKFKSVCQEAFDKTFDVVLPNGERRLKKHYLLGWPDKLPSDATRADKVRRGFAAVCAIVAMPFQIFLVKPIKFVFELPLKVLEIACARNHYDFLGEFFGIASSFFRYTFSFNPFQAAKECSSIDARPARYFGPVLGRWIGGFMGALFSLAGIAGFAFAAPTAILAAAGSTITGGLMAADATLGLANAGAATVGAIGGMAKLGVISEVASALTTSGVGLFSVAAGVGVVATVGSRTSAIMKELDIDPSSVWFTEPVDEAELANNDEGEDNIPSVSSAKEDPNLNNSISSARKL